MERLRARKLAASASRRVATRTDDDEARARHAASAPGFLLGLHKAAGNQAVLRFLSATGGPATDEAAPLPAALRERFEAAGGVSLRNVRVHSDSALPRQHGALAMTDGADIHIGPSHANQLPHEAWHVVQQKQGRVQPTGTDAGTQTNTDSALEQEADVAARSTKLVNAQPTEGKYTAVPTGEKDASSGTRVAQLAAVVKSLTVKHTGTAETETTASHSFDIRSELKEESPDWDFRQDIKGFWTLDGKPQTLKSSGSGATISKDSWSDDGYTKADNMSDDPTVFMTNDNPGGGFEKDKKEDYYLEFRARMIDPATGKNLKTKSGYWIRITGKYPRKFKKGGFD